MSAPKDRRFVLLEHEPGPKGPPRGLHWDLMLEWDGKLKTWALVQNPIEAGADASEAEQLPDHRLAYLDYEGPVSGDRGSVTRIDEGAWSATRCSADEWDITLHGRVLHGRYRLQRISDRHWQCVRLGD